MVNGRAPQRSDTDMIVQPLPLQLPTGALAVGAGTLPARIAGADQDLQVSAGEGGISLTPNSNAVFVVAGCRTLPNAADRLSLSSLTVSASSYGAGLALSDQTRRLVGLDHVTVATRRYFERRRPECSRPSRFVDAAGVVRIRMSAQTASLNISDPNDGVAIGVTGRVDQMSAATRLPSQPPVAAISVQGLVKQYGQLRAVDGLSMSVDPGSIYGFVGPNGAGKTTTMRILSTLLTASRGSCASPAWTSRRTPPGCAASLATCRTSSASTTT